MLRGHTRASVKKILREFLIRPISTTDDFSTFLSMHIKLHVIFDLSKIK